MAESEDLPRYTEEGPDFNTSIQDLLNSLGGQDLPILEHPELPPWRTLAGESDQDRDLRRMCSDIVGTYFSAIRGKNKDAVAALIEANIVTPNTTDCVRTTPLLAAIGKDDIRMVQCLVDFGAEIDAFGDWEGAQRTPLQLAALKGHLALVRLFVEVFHADDAKLAPDGELALRLAAQNGHYDVVKYLPARRRGGWLRWKTHHSKAMRRIRKAYEAILWFGRVVLWDIPRFFVWLCPKHLIVLPTYKALKWCWKQRHAVAKWCSYQAREMPHRLRRACLAVGQGVKKAGIATSRLIQQIPSAIINLCKATWKFFIVVVPRLVRKTVKFLYILVTEHIPSFVIWTSKQIWNFLTILFTKWIPTFLKWVWKRLVDFITVKIPRATKYSAIWVWNGMKTIGEALSNVLQRVVSFFHVVIAGAISLFGQITLRDISNALYSVIHSILVAVPKTIWSWVSGIPRLLYDVMEALFGIIGQIAACIVWAIVAVVVYVPKQLAVMVQSLGGSLAKACEEILVWFNPKR